MGRFNLLDEPWIRVLVQETGEMEEVSLRALFAHAHEYKRLAGEMETQNFALLRLLLAVLQTVFSRFDADGEPYSVLSLDERYRPVNEPDEDETEIYLDEMNATWHALWEREKFPPIVEEYLGKWHDRFFLLDDKYPFYQVTKEDVKAEKLNKSKPTKISGKNINRLISESDNKIAIFSPKYESNANKEKLSFSELARWLVMFQGYMGLYDKVTFGREKYKPSKGWLFNLGGIYLQGETLWESLLLNLFLLHPEMQYQGAIQRPCWEETPKERLKKLLSSDNDPHDLASLYTNWCRAIFLDPQIKEKDPIAIGVVKLPKIKNENAFLEPMTLWRWNKEQKKKIVFTPKKHRENQALWRSFGLLTLPDEVSDLTGGTLPNHTPGVLKQYSFTHPHLRETNISIVAISMQDNGNAASWLPTDEIVDELRINNVVLADIKEKGWIPRINEAVLDTRRMVERAYFGFLSQILKIRNDSSSAWRSKYIEQVYQHIDAPFREWLRAIHPDDSKDEHISHWKEQAQQLILEEAKSVIKTATIRDYRGIEEDGKIINIATAYRDLRYRLKQYL